MQLKVFDSLIYDKHRLDAGIDIKSDCKRERWGAGVEYHFQEMS